MAEFLCKVEHTTMQKKDNGTKEYKVYATGRLKEHELDGEENENRR